MMADYGFIARGLQPIDIASPLLQVEQIRQARAQEQRQNELLALRRQEMDDARKKAETQAAQTETQARLRAEIPSMEAAFAAGRGAEWMATKPELANFADQADNPQFVRMMRNYAYQAAGLEVPAAAPGPIEMRDMGDGVRVLMQDGKAVSGGVIRPESPSSQMAKPPPGYAWTDSGTLVAIPGGPAYNEMQEKESAATQQRDREIASMTTRVSDAENAATSLDQAEENIGFFSTGLIGQVFGNIGGTDAYNLRASINQLQSTIAFDRLGRMREESKTGGALGNVSERELALLSASIASLDPNQSTDQLKENLARVRKQYAKAMSAYRAMIVEKQQMSGAAKGLSAVPKISSDADYDALPIGARFIDPEGVTREKR